MAATAKVPAPMCKWIFVFVLSFTGISFTQGIKLNVPKVLLPYYSSAATNFTLEADYGCLKWRSSRPEIATIAPVGVSDPAGCATQAVVTAVSKTPSRMTSIIIAEDPVSGQQVRCDVIVDKIDAIDIETTTRELYLEDSPEQFVLRGLDDEGNVFSSLEGIAFDWSLISDTDVDQESIVDAHNIIRILKFSESNYETPSFIETMEREGKQGFSILVEGIRTGSAKVTAKLDDPAYKDLRSTVVRLIVIANIMLNPPLVYLMQHCNVHYRVELLKQGKVHPIPMPSQQYYLDVVNSSIGELDVKTSIVTAKQQGFTEVVLKDKNIKVKEAFRQPSAGLHVVTPGYLGFVVLPGRKWVLETQRNYEILIEIYDKDSHKIFPSDNVRVDATFDPEYFHVYSPSVNGTYHTVKTLKRGNTVIDGHLRAVLLDSGYEFTITPIIKNQQDVEIYDPIRVAPPLLVFPWDPSRAHGYHYPLTATGGSGNYTWSTSASGVASVNVRGEITTDAAGASTVTAADVRNVLHTDSMQVHVVPPGDMQFVLGTVEAEIGTTLELPLAMFGIIKKGEKVKFADCRHVPLQITLSDGSVFTHVPEMMPVPEGGCVAIKVRARKLGHTEVRAVYEREKTKLTATITIAAYKPLKPIDPEDIAVVAVGSSKEVVFHGGPQPWVLDSSKFSQTLNAGKKELIKIANVRGFGSQKSNHIFRVLCKDLGEQELIVTVQNGITSKNKFPAKATSSVRFSCAEPVGLHLTPRILHPEGRPPCPIPPDSQDAVPVHNYKDLDILVSVTDSSGRKFDNFSSLAFDWTLSNPNVADFGNNQVMQLTTETTGLGKVIPTYFHVLLMKGKLGTLSVSSKITGYKRNYLSLEGIQFDEIISPPIRSTLDLISVEDATIDPDFISVFNHPSNKPTLKVLGGSGHFLLDHGDTQFAKVLYEQKSRAIEVTPLIDGSFVIRALDLCLESREEARSQIHISGVSAIQLNVVDKVELTKEIKARVSVLDKKGKPLRAAYYRLMNLTPIPGSDIISLRPDDKKPADGTWMQYIVHGASLGRTTLQFTAHPPGSKTIHSQRRDIQVFPPLRLEPRNITILVGSLFQVTAYGGPQPQSNIEYSIVDGSVADISSSGLVDALELGRTVVVGKAVGYDSDTGARVVYSQDQVNVHVVELDGIKIFAPLKRLQTGTQMPLYAMGANEFETPFTFGSALPPLSFKWSINNKEAATIDSVYHKSQMKVKAESNFAVQLFAKQPGHVIVTLRVTPHPSSRLQIKDNRKLTDEVQIQVFERLQLTSPETCDGTIIITPHTEATIKTNRDGTAQLQYEIALSAGQEAAAPQLVRVTDHGQLVTGAWTGQASLLITAHEDFAVNQSLVVLVKVKPISYLMLNADTALHTSPDASLATVPVGTAMHFTVTYHDDVGEKFFATNTALKFRPSRFDLIHVAHGSTNDTIVAKTTSVGQTILKIWDDNNPRMADYINIDVGYAIKPAQANVTLGDVVCLTSPVVTASEHLGKWKSNSPILSIWNGIGVASHVGTAVVSYTVVSDNQSPWTTHTDVKVNAINKVVLKNENVQYLTNVATSRSKSISVPVYLEGSHSDGSNVVGSNCGDAIATSTFSVGVHSLPFKCELSMSSSHPDLHIEDLLSVLAQFDPKTGQYECRIQQVNSQELGPLISTLDTYVQLQAIVQPQEHQPEVPSGVISLPFLPAFHVHTSEVHVSNLLPLTSVRVSAVDKVIQDLKVSSSDVSIVEVLNAERDSQSEHVIHFPVRLRDRAALWELDKIDVEIEIKCVATTQKKIIPVRVKLIGQRQDLDKGVHQSVETGWARFFQIVGNNYQNWIFMLLCIIVTVFAFFIAYHAVLGSRYQAQNQTSTVFLQPGQQPVSPNYHHPSPWSSPYSTGSSPSKIPLWTSGYDASGGDSQLSTSLHRRSPHSRSPYSS